MSATSGIEQEETEIAEEKNTNLCFLCCLLLEICEVPLAKIRN